jgi:uncharacterized protein YkwD
MMFRIPPSGGRRSSSVSPILDVMRARLLIPVLSVAAIVCAAPAVAAPTASSAETGLTRASTLESSIVAELNKLRAAHGLRAVSISQDLTQAALRHTTSMIETGTFDHTSADGTRFDRRVARSYTPRGHSRWTVGENLLFQSGRLDAASAVKAWMQSPPHRKNLLNPHFREVGVGAVHASTAPGDFRGRSVVVVTLDLGARTIAHR